MIQSLRILCFFIPAFLWNSQAFCLESSHAESLSDNQTIPEDSSSLWNKKDWSVHIQSTLVSQYHPPFRANYSGMNSLAHVSETDHTTDATIYLGRRLWHGAEIYFNEEVDQGFGLSNTIGLAGFSSGEAYKIGRGKRYFLGQRLFIRQTFDLGGVEESSSDDINQLASTHTHDRLVLSLGKFSVVDLFDNNSYAHDPRQDFFNWSVIDAGAFDYAADAWGYTYGMAAEWTHQQWTMRYGLFDLSNVPNSTVLDSGFHQISNVVELEWRHQLLGAPGVARLLGFDNHGRFGTYHDALALAEASGTIPSTANVRFEQNRPGAVLNLEQAITPDLGIFARASFNNGQIEAYDFTDINQSISVGLSLKGTPWERPQDNFGAAWVSNSISMAAQHYFSAGGMGILIGDGRLNYAPEQIAEFYYSLSINDHWHISPDIQYIRNPAYNLDRGPVRVYGLRIHTSY